MAPGPPPRSRPDARRSRQHGPALPPPRWALSAGSGGRPAGRQPPGQAYPLPGFACEPPPPPPYPVARLAPRPSLASRSMLGPPEPVRPVGAEPHGTAGSIVRPRFPPTLPHSPARSRPRPRPPPRHGSSPVPPLPVARCTVPADAQSRLPPWPLPAAAAIQKGARPRVGGAPLALPGGDGGSGEGHGRPAGSSRPRCGGSCGQAGLAASGPRPRPSKPRQALRHDGDAGGRRRWGGGGRRAGGAAPGPCTKGRGGRLGAVAVGLAHGRQRGRKG